MPSLKKRMKRLAEAGRLNRELVRLMRQESLRPGEHSAGDWLRLLNNGELHVLLELTERLLHEGWVQDLPVEQVLATILLLNAVEQGPQEHYSLTLEQITRQATALSLLVQLELLSRMGLLRVEAPLRLDSLNNSNLSYRIHYEGLILNM